MNLRAHIREALANLVAGKLRSILATLGILVGTASVVAMVSGGKLATREALLQFKALGTDLLSLSINPADQSQQAGTDKAQAQKITQKDIFNIKKASSDIVDIAPYTNTYANISFGGHEIRGNVIGATENLLNIIKLVTVTGRFVSHLDKYSFFCALGNKVHKEIKKYTSNPIGKQVNLGKNIFTIIGSIEKTEDNSFVYADLNDAIFVPLQASLILDKYVKISNVVLKLKQNTKIEPLEEKIRAYFKKNIPGYRLYFRDAEQFIKQMKKQEKILTLFLGFVGSIALLVGGIGVMNIMLVSVMERRREIGVRIAIGAKRRDIQSLFLTESVILSLFGGTLGVITGVLISFLIAVIRHWHITIFFNPIILGFTVSVFIGVFFGFYPAYKAAKLDPIETLRAE